MGSLLDQIKSTARPKKGGSKSTSKSGRRPTARTVTRASRSTTARPRSANRPRAAKTIVRR
tara:strand:- start:253 stop:435 length:183 start_codon:yes stop_codon:yes gene_type:complete